MEAPVDTAIHPAHPGPQVVPMSARTERVLLMMQLSERPVNVDDVLSWRIEGRPPTGGEVRLLRDLELADVRDWRALMELHQELADAVNDVQWGGQL